MAAPLASYDRVLVDAECTTDGSAAHARPGVAFSEGVEGQQSFLGGAGVMPRRASRGRTRFSWRHNNTQVAKAIDRGRAAAVSEAPLADVTALQVPGCVETSL